MNIDVILPAGGRIAGAFAAQAGTEIKALISVSGHTILERTIATARALGPVENIVVVGPDELASHPATREADGVLLEGASGPDNIFRGLAWLHEQRGARHAHRTLVLTTDLPFINSESVAGFLAACPDDVEVCLPIIEKRAFETCFPGAPNQYVRLRDGAWTLGCAFLFDPVAIIRHRLHIERIFAARKSQMMMAQLLGPLFIARLLTRRLTVVHIQNRCEQILGCAGAVVLGCAPELAYDIDLPQEYQYAVHYAGAECQHKRK